MVRILLLLIFLLLGCNKEDQWKTASFNGKIKKSDSREIFDVELNLEKNEFILNNAPYPIEKTIEKKNTMYFKINVKESFPLPLYFQLDKITYTTYQIRMYYQPVQSTMIFGELTLK